MDALLAGSPVLDAIANNDLTSIFVPNLPRYVEECNLSEIVKMVTMAHQDIQNMEELLVNQKFLTDTALRIAQNCKHVISERHRMPRASGFFVRADDRFRVYAGLVWAIVMKSKLPIPEFLLYVCEVANDEATFVYFHRDGIDAPCIVRSARQIGTWDVIAHIYTCPCRDDGMPLNEQIRLAHE